MNKDVWEDNAVTVSFGCASLFFRFLAKYLDKLVNGRSGITVFVPLCGKSVDMKL